jgi:hypothetical protein
VWTSTCYRQRVLTAGSAIDSTLLMCTPTMTLPACAILPARAPSSSFARRSKGIFAFKTPGGQRFAADTPAEEANKYLSLAGHVLRLITLSA